MDLAATAQAVTAGASGLPFAVAGAVLVAAIAHAAWNAIAHGISDKLVAFALLGIGSWLCAAPLVLLAAPPDPRSWPYLLLSVALHLTYNLLLMLSYRLGDFSQVYPLARGTSPVVVTVLAAVLVGEVPPRGQALGVLLISTGLGLVEPIYRACLRHPNIRFRWATMAEDLIIRNGRVTGVWARDLRRQTRDDLRARHVIVATGGFQSNLKTVLANWPSELPKPTRLLVGAARSATGSGHDFVRRANGSVSRLDHQWNYVLGLPDPRDPSRTRGLAAFNFNGIWVNANGKRFAQEFGDAKLGLRALLNQPGGTYWSVFDEEGKDGFSITLAGYENLNEVRQLVYDTPGVVLRGDSVEKLAVAMGVPPENLRATVSRYNKLVTQGVDLDFQAFGEKTSPKPKPIDTPPFYAAQFFPLTRKSMGGVDVDMDCRVLDQSGRVIPGLFAVGEVTGFGGINGKAALEGTFLGPAIYMGRIAGRRIAQDLVRRPRPDANAPVARVSPRTTFINAECLKCHDVANDVKQQRPGYWHYEQSHAKALSRQYSCSSCHGDLFPYRATAHRLDRSAIVTYCRACHGVQPREGPAARPGNR